MILDNCKNNIIYKELDDNKRVDFFDIRAKKVIHNIDTLYFTCNVKEDYYANTDFINFLDDFYKNLGIDDLEIFPDLFMSNKSFMCYKYNILKKEKFDIYFTKVKTLETVPPIFVQIRSAYLWEVGEYKALENVVSCINYILSFFDMSVSSVVENRVDYAYHTNYIRDLSTFFKLENLNSMQVSNFKRWSMQGNFIGDNDTKTDYISLGRRKSNNIFLRIYNKTKEVIEMGYKQFFIEYWYSNKLISFYDKWIYEKCFVKSNYEYIDTARLEFYLKYGLDQGYKFKIKEVLSKKDNLKNISSLAALLTPPITIIVNVEFQTKRKFYSTIDDFLSLCKSITPVPIPCLFKIYKLLDNKITIHNVLTQDVFRLIDVNDNKSRKRNKKVSSFWLLVQGCDLNSFVDNKKAIRKYQRNLDILKVKNMILNSLVNYSLYHEEDNKKDVYEDVIDFISTVNDNDLVKARNYKIKKAPILKSRTSNLSDSVISKKFQLLDVE